MINIRFRCFETNSSSVHSLVICTAQMYDNFANGLLFKGWNEKFYTKEQIIDSYPNMQEVFDRENKEEIELELAELDFFTINNYFHDYEPFAEEFTTPNGDTVVAFGYHGGRDG